MSTPGTDLWASAQEALTDLDRQQLASYDGRDMLALLSDLQIITESARDQCIKKRWRFRLGRNGETIVLRDIFNKMVVWINMFKQIGDTVMQYDPGHAALPWAGVRFILQVAVGDIVKFDFVVDGTESIARMLGRYAIFEDIYLRHTSKASNELKNALIRLYSTILLYQSKAKSFFDQSSSKRILKSTLITEDEFENLAKKMIREQSNVDHYAAILDAQNQNSISDSLETLSISQCEKYGKLIDLLHSIDGPILRMASQLNSIEDHLDKSKRDEILRWVSAQPYVDHHEQISKNALAGTGRWLLEDPIYAEWYRGSTSSLLWLHGKVGAGKSTLCSIVIGDTIKRFEAGQCPPPVYFYCSRNAAEPQRSDPSAILSSIVRQLSCAKPGGLPLLPPIIEMYEKKGQGFDSQGLHIDKARELITALAEYYPVTTIIIDALDECDPEEREMLLDAIESLLQDSSLGLLKVFLSSRDDQDIACQLRNYPNLELVSSRNSTDIEAFVREETDRLIKKRRLLRNSHAKEELKVLITNEVSRSADGMFRWASLQLELLCSMKLDQDVRSRLGQIPPKLEELYGEIYEKNLLNHPGEVGRSIISNVMKWLLCAQRPMKSSEFCTAVVLKTAPMEDLTKEQILDLCHNFVVFDDNLDVFRFAHLSVREFLEKQASYTAKSCHLFAAETCMLYFIGLSEHSAAKAFILRHYTSELRDRAASTTRSLGDFENYAITFWAKHCQLIGEEGRKGDPCFKRTFRFFLSHESDDLSPFNLWVKRYQLRALTPRLRSRDFWFLFYLRSYSAYKDANRVLYVACAYAFCEILRVCMDDGPPKSWEEVLGLAIESNEGEVLDILLRNRGENTIPIRRVSRVAQLMDHDTLEKVLRESNIGLSALVDYSDSHDKEVADRLISIFESSEALETLLGYAARFCSAKTFESLLRQSDDALISRDLLLEEAGRGGNWEVMRLLLEEKVSQITPSILETVARIGDEKAMQLLLDRDDSVEISSEVINASLSNQSEKVLVLLLSQAGVGEVSRVAISGAIENSNEKTLSLLLNNGYPMSQNLVDAVAATGYASTLRLLLDRGGLITGLVLRCAAGNHRDGANMISLLLAEAETWMIMENLAAMIRLVTSESKRLLLEWARAQAGDIQFTEDVLAAVVVREPHGELLNILSRGRWELTEDVLEVMMRTTQSEEALLLILERTETLKITETVLLGAACNDSFGDKLVGLLLDRLEHLDVIDSLLVEAAGNRPLGLEVILLLQHRFGSINVTHDAIERAAHQGSIQTMMYLLNHMSTPITEAIVVSILKGRDQEMAQLALSRATDLPVTREMVHAAARYSGCECLASIWKRAWKAELTEDVTRDLALAAIENDQWPEEKLKFLLDQVKNIVVGPEALIRIAEKDTKSVELLNLLIDRGMNLEITPEVLEAAARNDDNDGSLMTFLLERSDKIVPTEEHFRAAAGAGGKAALQVLSNYCGMVEIPQKWVDLDQLRGTVSRHWPLSYIQQDFYDYTRGEDVKIDVVKELLAKGVEPDVPDSRGQTLCMFASRNGEILTVQTLVSAGADPNRMDKGGRTPIFFAAANGHYGVVEILLDLGVSTHLRDERGDNPASAAKNQGFMKVFRLLERRRQP